VVFFVLAAAPLAVFADVITLAHAVTDQTRIVTMFPVVGAALALFCVGYMAMSRRISHPPASRKGATMSSLSAVRPSAVSRTLAADRLSAIHVVFFVLAAAAPLTVFAGVITVAYAVTGLTSIAIAFPVIGGALALFAVGYLAMSRRIANAGAFYAYISQGLGRPLGVAAALVAFAAYACFGMAGFGGIGAAFGGLVDSRFGVDWPWWSYAAVAWVILTVLGALRITVSARVLAVLLVAETAVIVLYDLVGIGHPAGGQVSMTALNPASLWHSGVGAALAIAVTGFVGIEGGPVLAEEVRDPRRTVARATYAAIGLITVLYTVSAWAMTVAAGPDHIVALTQAKGADTVFSLAGAHLPLVFVDLGRALFATSIFAATLSFWAFGSRYLFSLGREGVLPRVLGTTGVRTNAPWVASAVLSVLSVIVIGVYVIAGADPLVNLMYAGGALGGFGVLLLLAVTSFAVVGYFTRHGGQENTWTRLVAPLVSGIVLSGAAVLALANFDVLLGVAPDSALRWALPAAYAVLAAAGLGLAFWVRRRDPGTYQAIGLGSESSTGRATSLTMTGAAR
jgi:amino acid transporter